ncbi:MAG: MFS transporter [Chlamydiia bacterium]
MSQSNVFQCKWWALIGVSLLAFTAFLDATIVNTALPFIQSAFKVNVLQLQWVANIFTIILSMTMIAIGKFADRWGKKKIFYIGVVLFTIAAFGAGFSNSIQMLIFFRGMQAIGASTLFITAAALLSDIFPESERVKAISIYGGITGFGLMSGPFFGGILIDLLDWRWVFWINLPLIAIGLGACSFSLKKHKITKTALPIDWMGMIGLVTGLGALMYGIIGGAEKNWQSLPAWCALGLGISALIFLIIWDIKKQNALLNLTIFKHHLVILAALSCGLAGVVSTVFMFFDPLYLRTLRQLSPFMIGLLIAIIPAAQSIISLLFQKLVKWLGISNLLFLSIFSAFIAISLHRFLSATTPIGFLILPFFLLGITWGLGNVGTITALNQVIRSSEIASALGTITTIWNMVGSILLASSTAVFHAIELHSSFLRGFLYMINVNIIFSGIILIISIKLLFTLKSKIIN